MRLPGHVLAVLLVALGSSWAQDSPRDHAGWWIEQFGVLDPARDPLAARAEAVFKVVSAVADKNSRRRPRLILLGGEPGAFAAALPDGSVILTRAGLLLSYRGVNPPAGDARLAFVLGHELAHLARDDFWHAFAEQAVRAAPDGRPGQRRALLPLVKEGPEQARAKELQADEYGIAYMMMAGYRPDVVLRRHGSFLEEWAAQTASESGQAPSHPRAGDRAALLRAELASVVEYVDFFSFGVRLYQLGRYQDAILLLERFKDRFPSREVSNNLGLAHYQLASRVLAGCDPDELVRFRLPTVLDPDALLKRVTVRGPKGARCAENPVLRRHLEEAVTLLEDAQKMDGTYLPARVNLASALIMMGDYPRAFAAARAAIALAPENAAAANAQALALYLFGEESAVETADAALKTLAEARQRAPGDAAAAYNMAALLRERGRTAEAAQAWRDFLAREPEGLFAEAARRKAGLAPEPSARPVPAAPLGGTPLPLGPVDAAAKRRLASLRVRPFDMGTIRGAFYEGKGLRALQLESSIELVEEDLAGGATAVAGCEGPLVREVEGPSSRTRVYSAAACDVADGQVRRRLLFVP